MKIRITALILAMVMLLMILSGCGAAETEPEATTMAATEAPTTEPTMEPTTEPTEPPTALEQMGYEVLDDASSVDAYGGWEVDGVEMPISKATGIKYDNFKTFFYINNDNVNDGQGKELYELVDGNMRAFVCEFSGSSFSSDIDWLREKLSVFYEDYKSQTRENLSYEDWCDANQDQKLIYVDITQHFDGMQLEDKIRTADFVQFYYGVDVLIMDIIDMDSGEFFNATSTEPSGVGHWCIEHKGEAVDISIWYHGSGTWYGENGMTIDYIQEMLVLMPEGYNDFCFSQTEFIGLMDEELDEAEWKTGNILDDDKTKLKRYCFNFAEEEQVVVVD